MSTIQPGMMTLPTPDNRGHLYLGVLVGLGIPAVIAIVMRTIVRLKYTKLWWDDYLMLFVLPLLISNHALSLASIKHGVGQHLLLLNPKDAMEAARLNVIAQPLNIWALFFVKASIVLFLVRLRPGKRYLYILWGTFFTLVAVTVEVFIVTMAQCQPIARSWNPTIKEGFCWSPNVFQYSAYFLSSITILTDIVYITIPIFFLWNVQLNRKVKYGIWAVLSLGLISMGCTIASIPFIYQLGLSTDPTYTIIDLASVKSGELNVAILCACMPPMQPLFKRAGQVISNLSLGRLSSNFSNDETQVTRRNLAKPRASDSESNTEVNSTTDGNSFNHNNIEKPLAKSMTTWLAISNSSRGSDEFCPEDQPETRHSTTGLGIVRTTDVTVSYGNRI